MISFSIFLHAFHTFRPRFLGFENFLGFVKIDELFVKILGWVLDRSSIHRDVFSIYRSNAKSVSVLLDLSR